MSRLSIRALLVAMLGFSLVSVVGCSSDPEQECETNDDCEEGQICNDDGECVGFTISEEECTPETEDEDCAADEICLFGVCQEGCRTTSDCGDNQVCEAEQCVNIPNSCEDDGDCPGSLKCKDNTCVLECASNEDCNGGRVCGDGGQCRDCLGDDECDAGQVCSSGRCAVLEAQCNEVGQACTPGAPTRIGFDCGRFEGEVGYTCKESCRTVDICTPGIYEGDPGAVLYFDGQTCTAGSICEQTVDGFRACRRSDCTDPVVGQVECADVVQREQANAASCSSDEDCAGDLTCKDGLCTLFPNGANCNPVNRTKTATVPRGANLGSVIVDDTAFICEPAGVAQEGEQCGGEPTLANPNPAKCAEGLTCVNEFGLFGLNGGVCQRPCTSDLQCNPDEQCIGEDTETEFNTVGICGQRCEPFTVDADACPAGTKCLAISAEDGMCTDLLPEPGPSEVYGPCPNGDADCPNGTICLNLGEGRCLPQCDPTLRTQEDSDAQCFGGNPKAYVKFVHAAQRGGTVNIFIDGVLVVDGLESFNTADDGGTWIEVEPGVHTVDIARGMGNNRISLQVVDVDFEANTASFMTILPQDGTPSLDLVAFEDQRIVSPPSGTNARFRIAHGVVGVADVDIVATARGADVSLPNNQVELFTGLAFGETTPYLDVNGGTYDVYVFNAGDTRSAATAQAVFSDTMLAPGYLGTVIAYGLTEGSDPRTPGLYTVEYERFQDIPVTPGYCYDLNQGTSDPTRPSTGVCFQTCPTYKDYGTGTCTEANDACQPFGDDISVCFVQGAAQVGEACGGADGIECTPGSFCDEKGDGTGTCRSYCTVDGFEDNGNLVGCQGDEVCMPNADIGGLGECRLPCEPDMPGVFKDSDCPAGQQTCRPDPANNFYCGPSGDVAINAECVGGDTSPTSFTGCEAGSLCTRDILVPDSGFQPLLESFLSTLGGEVGSCRQICRPFLPWGESDCPDGYACNPLMPTQEVNTNAGICLPTVSQVGSDTDPEFCPGDEVGRLCGDAAFCVTESTNEDNGNDLTCDRTANCFYLCDPASGAGCPPDKECANLGSTDVPSYFVGVYGICRDRT